MIRQVCRQIIEELKKRNITSQKQLGQLKLEILRESKVKEVPTNVDLASCATIAERKKYGNLLTIKPTRSMSGVSVAAIMTKPFKCPHGKCATCPGGIDSVFGDVPQSYTGKEPATRRALRNEYDSYLQMFNRLEQYVAMNKVPDKIELIIMGGTFPSYPKKYRDDFITYSLKAMNDFGEMFFKKNVLSIDKFVKFFEIPSDISEEGRMKRVLDRVKKLKGKSNLEKEQKRNEKAKIRCVGLTLETRPDYADADEMLRLGATRVELGIQSVYGESLLFIERGHTAKQSVDCIRKLKDAGFKLNYHYMPGLVPYKKDLKGMMQLFEDPDYRPDMLKIYPCMVLKGTKLYQMWKEGKYKPLTTRKAADLIAEFKQYVPPYCRIMRVQRDIPTSMTEAGVDRTNLRQYIDLVMKNKSYKCKCIRCREAGRALKIEKCEVIVLEYDASKGKEFFISYEDVKNNVLLGFCRMRYPFEIKGKEITSKSALIRELHVYGDSIGIGKKGTVQHKGIGKELLKTAEKIASGDGKNKTVIISGIGVREYYRKLGYKKQGPYMVRKV